MKKLLDRVQTYPFAKQTIEDVESPVNEQELFNALKDMKKDKAPGFDGLTVEFYLTYWNVIKNDFVDVINYCYREKKLPNSMNLALIRLIFKNKGERNNLKNWRPISLLNVDYKIIAKLVTKRISKLMPFVIAEDQTCGVKGRHIQDNLMILRDTIDYVNFYNKEAAIISIDQEKAFDRIEWRYMYAMMEKMGIPFVLQEWVHIFYSNPMFSVNVNNFLTEPCAVTRGIRQGCPLSPLLYTICAEGLANLIRTSQCIKGLELNNTSFKIIQHADDASIFVTDNKDFPALDKIFYTFSEGTGSKINTQKTKGLWLGAWKNRKDNPGNFNWTNDKIKILGIFFGNGIKPEDNWTERVNKIKNVLNRWKARSLTMKGKAVIANSLIGAVWHITVRSSLPQLYCKRNG